MILEAKPIEVLQRRQAPLRQTSLAYFGSHVGHVRLSGWWFPDFGNDHPNWLSYFSEGWLNHQPVVFQPFSDDRFGMAKTLPCCQVMQGAFYQEDCGDAMRVLLQQLCYAMLHVNMYFRFLLCGGWLPMTTYWNTNERNSGMKLFGCMIGEVVISANW